jgi:hypothetical protein
MHGLGPRDGAGQQSRGIAREVLGARLIVHLAIVWESRQTIGRVQQAYCDVTHCRHGGGRPGGHGRERKRRSGEKPHGTATHGALLRGCVNIPHCAGDIHDRHWRSASKGW